MEDDEIIISRPLMWVGVDDLPIHFSNQALFQSIHPDEIVITLGSVTMPPVIGTPEEQREQLQAWISIPVRPFVRFVLNRQRAEELVSSLGAYLERTGGTGGTQ